jgi:hypothetical protein
MPSAPLPPWNIKPGVPRPAGPKPGPKPPASGNQGITDPSVRVSGPLTDPSTRVSGIGR